LAIGLALFALGMLAEIVFNGMYSLHYETLDGTKKSYTFAAIRAALPIFSAKTEQ
jgi:hypothetical protein